MKKIFFITALLFWSMFFPSLSFNKFTSELNDISSPRLEIFDTKSNVKILENAEYRFRLLSKWGSRDASVQKIPCNAPCYMIY